jgi:copper(I)-binding protein
MTMKHHMMVEIPAQGELEFAPGGYHVMFMGLSDGWTVGDEIEASLQFKNAGTLDIKFSVTARP